MEEVKEEEASEIGRLETELYTKGQKMQDLQNHLENVRFR